MRHSARLTREKTQEEEIKDNRVNPFENDKSNGGFECDEGLSNNEEINNPPDSPTATVRNNKMKEVLRKAIQQECLADTQVYMTLDG